MVMGMGGTVEGEKKQSEGNFRQEGQTELRHRDEKVAEVFEQTTDSCLGWLAGM